MAKKSDLCQDANGRFVRNLGWKRTPKGYGQQKFYLGRDHSKAKVASLKLEQLWLAVCRRWEAQTLTVLHPKPGQSIESMGRLVRQTRKPETGGPAVSMGMPEIEEVRQGRPVWDDVTLTIAEAIRKAEAVARIAEEVGVDRTTVYRWGKGAIKARDSNN